uniref:histone deacetylase 4-like n=1 Tax=Myxine glutinosa TaxID=7769 RepID=UPI00358E38C9
MLQTIYETESSFAADCVVSKEKLLSLGVRCQLPVVQSLTAESSKPMPVAGEDGGPAVPGTDGAAANDQQLQNELLQLKQQHQLQQQLLLDDFRQKQEQLARQHHAQLHQYLQQQQQILALKKHQELVVHQRQEQQQQQQQMEFHRQERDRIEKEINSELKRLQQAQQVQQDQQKQQQQHQQQQHQQQQLQQHHQKQQQEQQQLPTETLTIQKEMKELQGRERAAASSEVKQRLQEFVLSKKQRIAPGVTISLSRYHNLWMQHYATMEQNSAAQNISQAALHPGLISCDPKNNFPLRKTASEPNLKLRSRLKQKVAERRSSPLLRRKGPGVMALVKKRPIDITESPVSSSAPGSGPSSPSNGNISVSLLNGTTAIIPAKPKHATEQHGVTEGNAASRSLHISPSLPNISLGLPLSGAVQTAHLSAIMALSAKQQQQQTTKSCSSGPAGHFATSLPLYLISRHADVEHGVGHSSSQPDLLRTAGPKTEAGHLPAQLLPGERPRLPHRRILNRTHSSPLPQSLQALHHLLRQQQLLVNQRQAAPTASSPEVHRPSMQTSKGEKGIPTSQQDEVVPMQEDDDDILVKGSHHIPTYNDNHNVELETIVCDEINDRVPNNTTLEDKQVLSLYQKTTSPDLPQAGCQGKPPTGPLLPKAVSRRSLFRTQSSPAFTLLPQPVIPTIRKPVFTTGLVYDVLMLKHQCICGDINNHPEHTGRIQSIWSRLQETGLLNKCERVCGRKATLEELQLVHTEQHTLMYGTSQLDRRDCKQLPAPP